MASTPTKPFYKDATFAQTTGLSISQTISDHTQSLDIANQNRAPLNWRDVRDFSDYRYPLIKTKDQVLKAFRSVTHHKDQVRCVLLYRNLQRYHKVDPVPITPQGYAMRQYLDEKINNAIKDEPLAVAHKGYFDDLFKLHYYVLDLAQNLSIPNFNLKKQAAQYPSFDRFKTLTNETKEKQIKNGFNPRYAVNKLLAPSTGVAELYYNYNSLELPYRAWMAKNFYGLTTLPAFQQRLAKAKKVYQQQQEQQQQQQQEQAQNE